MIAAIIAFLLVFLSIATFIELLQRFINKCKHKNDFQLNDTKGNNFEYDENEFNDLN
jgi:hypothetical protein